MAHPTKASTRGAQQPTQNRKRDDRGLTTLEWLLIVAAVAGLAALAVVLVQNVVDDTAEQISGSSARLTAANVAAAEITVEATSFDTDEDGDGTNDSEDQNNKIDSSDKESDLQAKCDRLRITYGDALDGAQPKRRVIWHNTGNGSSGLMLAGAAFTAKSPSCNIVDVAP